MSFMSSLTQEAVIITGAGRGLGRGAAIELAHHGYSVVINYRTNEQAATETADICRTTAQRAGHSNTRFVTAQADISSPAARRSLIDLTLETFSGIRALVNNAGMAPQERRDILEATEESFAEVIATNLQGPYFLTQLVAQHWLSARALHEPLGTIAVDQRSPRAPGTHTVPPHRSVIFVTSISATTVSLNRGEYCVSKAGLAMANQLWAARLAPYGIGVYEIRPGIMETDMTAGVHEKYTAAIGDGLVPQQRWGTPEDIGRAVRSFVSGDFAFSTGSAIYSDGGIHMSRL